ncbi:sulfite exporter TauE/SafE family protein [Falsiroseomonas oryzae]|uniref:sulfite exporter TauE/SafE family protein n=1 Tax=Falsiroseomonas oryzae TaxID=2766473 RepID=UPI0022EA36C8|nr:sulfite exporter TauE/SafE family protein [Roseomonas sp. MO-31]
MWSEALILSAGCFVAAFCAGMAGFAFVLVAAGILLHFIPPTVTAPVLVLGSLFVQSLAMPTVWRDIAWPRMRLYVAAATLGVPVGLLILAFGPARAIVMGVGVLLIVYAGYALARMALRQAPSRFTAAPPADAAVGFASGILGGIGGYVGALPAMWADIQGMDKRDARALMQPFIVFMQAITTPGLFFGGFLTEEALLMTASAVPAMLAGTWLGVRAYKVIPAQGFRLVLLGLLLVSGVSLVI